MEPLPPVEPKRSERISNTTKRKIFDGIGVLLKYIPGPPGYSKRDSTFMDDIWKKRIFLTKDDKGKDGVEVLLMEAPINYTDGTKGIERRLRVNAPNPDNTTRLEIVHLREIKEKGKTPIMQCDYYNSDLSYDPNKNPWAVVIELLSKFAAEDVLASGKQEEETHSIDVITTPFSFSEETPASGPKDYGEWADFSIGSGILTETRGLALANFLVRVQKEILS